MFHELDVVLVRRLRSTTRPVDGTDGVKRQPRVGDQGTIVHVPGPQSYVVENADRGGRTIWLADFVEDELASPPHGWDYATEEVSAGVYRATVTGPGGMRADATDPDESVALAACREFALRYSLGIGRPGTG